MTLLAFLVALTVPSAEANERRFTYTYESLAMPKGVRELEPWTTVIFPRAEGEGLAFRQRMEFEVGLTDHLLTAFYLNWEAGTGGSEFTGVSSEWKLNLTSRSTQAVGVALYGEASVGPKESELEAKVIVDKEVGQFVVAYNLVGEFELEREEEVEADGEIEVEWEKEAVLGHRIGLSYKVGKVSLGAEILQDTEFKGDETEILLGAGPAIGWAGKGVWGALTVPVRFLEVADGETEVEPAVDARVILGFDF